VAVPTDDLAVLEFQDVRLGEPRFSLPARSPSPVRTDLTVFFLADGGRLSGRLTGQGEERITVDVEIGEGTELPLSSLAGIWFGSSAAGKEGRARFDETMADRLPGKDVLLIWRDNQLNAVRGSIMSLGPEGGQVLINQREFEFKREVLIGIAFAAGVGSPSRGPVTARLADGAGFAGTLIEANTTQLTMSASFGARVILPLEHVAQLRFESDRVVSLSDLTPVGNASAGRLLAARDARFDRNVMNRPLSINGVTYTKGLGVHANSRLEYALDATYETMAAAIGIDDAVRPRGSVVYRIEGDGRELFNSGLVTGRDDGRNIVVDVRGLSRLALVVEDGDGLDVSDFADWAGARLIKPRNKD